MEFIIVVIAAIAIWIYFQFSSVNTESRSNSQSGISPSLQNSLEKLQRAMGKCQQEHEAATLALTWLASSDGTISRQELRIIVNFCINQGTEIPSSDLAAIDNLNSGLNMKITGGENAALENMAELKSKPMHYRAAFLGATEAICAANKTVNASKKRFLQAARELLNA